ncbi:hypothetical protein TWF481_006420 [Arthrobotrys musiformis]|uniref:Uncharacterized protein n=1 Tax=Arthrobotrys musiformis TaxID=47236 RepID=A0AAV9WGP8_9PEZI
MAPPISPHYPDTTIYCGNPQVKNARSLQNPQPPQTIQSIEAQNFQNAQSNHTPQKPQVGHDFQDTQTPTSLTKDVLPNFQKRQPIFEQASPMIEQESPVAQKGSPNTPLKMKQKTKKPDSMFRRRPPPKKSKQHTCSPPHNPSHCFDFSSHRESLPSREPQTPQKPPTASKVPSPGAGVVINSSARSRRTERRAQAAIARRFFRVNEQPQLEPEPQLSLATKLKRTLEKCDESVYEGSDQISSPARR